MGVESLGFCIKLKKEVFQLRSVGDIVISPARWYRDTNNKTAVIKTLVHRYSIAYLHTINISNHFLNTISCIFLSLSFLNKMGLMC